MAGQGIGLARYCEEMSKKSPRSLCTQLNMLKMYRYSDYAESVRWTNLGYPIGKQSTQEV
jgi:hypothetical protein